MYFFCLLLVLFEFVLLRVHGLVHPQPKPTLSAADYDAVNGWTPRPTRGPLFPAGGAIYDHQLFGRQVGSDVANAKTCGYVSADAHSPLVCPTGQGCFYWTGTPPYNGLCIPTSTSDGTVVYSSNPPYFTTCVNWNLNINTWYGTVPFINAEQLSWYVFPPCRKVI